MNEVESESTRFALPRACFKNNARVGGTAGQTFLLSARNDCVSEIDEALSGMSTPKDQSLLNFKMISGANKKTFSPTTTVASMQD
jgi:hypothetical protein